MFEHRLGLALGKSVGEIRALPYEEFQSWKHFYSYEPWGWHDVEYRTGLIAALLWNTHTGKKSQAKKISDYVRDMPKLIEQEYLERKRTEELAEKMRTASKEEKKRMIMQSLGVKK